MMPKTGRYSIQDGTGNSGIENDDGMLRDGPDPFRKEVALVAAKSAVSPSFVHLKPVNDVGIVRSVKQHNGSARFRETANQGRAIVPLHSAAGIECSARASAKQTKEKTTC